LKAGVLKADTYDSTLNPAREEDLSHLAFLQMMVQDEIERREAKKLQQRIAKLCGFFRDSPVAGDRRRPPRRNPFPRFLVHLHP